MDSTVGEPGWPAVFTDPTIAGNWPALVERLDRTH